MHSGSGRRSVSSSTRTSEDLDSEEEKFKAVQRPKYVPPGAVRIQREDPSSFEGDYQQGPQASPQQVILSKLPSFPQLRGELASLGKWQDHFKGWDAIGEIEDIPRGKPLPAWEERWMNERGFFFLRQLGSGTSGTVWLVRSEKLFGETKLLACKVTSLQAFLPEKGLDKSFEDTVNAILDEGKVHFSLHHFNLVECYQVMYIPNPVTKFPVMRSLLMMEQCDGDLVSLIKDKPGRRLNGDESRQWFKQVCNAVAFLHRINVCHFDIKLSNVMYVRDRTGHYTYKLADFGLACQFASRHATHDAAVGTRKYMPPEMFQLCFDGPTSSYPAQPADIYCLGVALAESISGLGRQLELIDACQRNWGSDLLKSFNVPVECAKLIRQMTAMEPSNRPTIEEVARNPWVRGK